MENNYEKFKNTLKTIFQIDRADLDFGIYRILNQKHDEITTFLYNDLLPQVKKELAVYEAGDQAELEAELAKITSQLKELGVSEDQIVTNDKVREISAKLQTAGRVAELESEVFSHLLRFFERYYEEGDFISKRRYKDGVYAIPYEGEEVKLHWANHDQYYIKTSEKFKDFSFRVSGKSIHFRIREAETDANNNKNISGKDRRFVLCEEDFWSEQNGELNLYFQYVGVEGKKKQDECSAQASARILSAVSSVWRDLLAAPAPTEKNKERTTLDKFLTSYTATNTFDYFIHKDLGTFLTRELDFYIKNEVLFLDDIENESAPRADQYLAKVKVIRVIAKKIIRMLAQLEDFQKKLWEKKKFVVGTGYCITLDLVPDQYYESILNNSAQRAEWTKLGFIDQTTELSFEYLKNHPTLSIDTKFFPEWKDELLATFDNLDERVNGVMINSENFGALNVLQEQYKEKVKSIYIDPPYNTDASKILYKNNYEHSSWLSLLADRYDLAKNILTKNGIIATTIDDYESGRLLNLLDSIYGSENQLGILTIRINPKGRITGRKISPTHEFAFFYGKSEGSSVSKFEVAPEDKSHNYQKDTDGTWFLPINLRKQGVDSEAEKNGKISHRYYPVYFDPQSNRISTSEAFSVEIWPIDSDGNKRIWRRSKEEVENMFSRGDVWVKEIAGNFQVYFKFRGGLEGEIPKSMWYDAKYSASEYGTKTLDDLLGKRELFSYPKSPFAVQDTLRVMSSEKDTLTIDFFAGSGTTGHAVLRLNSEDNIKSIGSGNRKYILIEMGAYFDTVTKPRIQKVIYSDRWDFGKPQDNGETGTREHIMKYFKLESYEDTLNNLELHKTPDQQATLDAHKHLREEYMLEYMLDVETKASLLTLNTFKNPFGYNIKLATDVVGETKETTVDLVETFNYLIGLNVATMRKHGEHLLVVEGETRVGEKTLIIWRNQEVVDNAGLDDFFRKQALSTTDFEYHRIYVNGDNNLENLKADGDQWKVVTIEEEFHKRMFA